MKLEYETEEIENFNEWCTNHIIKLLSQIKTQFASILIFLFESYKYHKKYKQFGT